MALAVGQRLRRRDPAGDAWDEVIVGGYHDLGETQEVVVSPAAGFAAPVSATPQSLLAAYSLDTNPPEPIEWATPESEVAA